MNIWGYGILIFIFFGLIYIFIRLMANRITKIIKVNLSETIKKYQDLIENTTLHNTNTLDKITNSQMDKLKENESLLLKVKQNSNEMLNELQKIAIFTKALENTLNTRTELENEIIKLKKILKRKSL